MKRIIVVALAVLMLAAMPKPSEASDSWVPAAIIGGIIIGAAISQATDSGPVHVYHAPSPAYVHRPPAPVYVNPPRMNKYNYCQGHGKKYGHWHGRGQAGPPQHHWHVPYR